MDGSGNPQHRVVDHLVTVRMNSDGFGHDGLYFLSHYPKLPAVSPLFPVFRFVIEQVKAKSKWMCVDANGVFFDAPITRNKCWGHAILTTVTLNRWCSAL